MKYQAGYSRTVSRDAIAILGLVNRLTDSHAQMRAYRALCKVIE